MAYYDAPTAASMNDPNSRHYIRRPDPPVLGGYGETAAYGALGLGALLGYRYNKAKAAKALASEAKLDAIKLADDTKRVREIEARLEPKLAPDAKPKKAPSMDMTGMGDSYKKWVAEKPARDAVADEATRLSKKLADDETQKSIDEYYNTRHLNDLTEQRNRVDTATRKEAATRSLMEVKRPSLPDTRAFDDDGDIFRPLVDEVHGPLRPQTMPQPGASATPEPGASATPEPGASATPEPADLSNAPDVLPPALTSFDPTAGNIPKFKALIEMITDIEVLEGLRPRVKGGRLDTLNNHIAKLKKKIP